MGADEFLKKNSPEGRGGFRVAPSQIKPAIEYVQSTINNSVGIFIKNDDGIFQGMLISLEVYKEHYVPNFGEITEVIPASKVKENLFLLQRQTSKQFFDGKKGVLIGTKGEPMAVLINMVDWEKWFFPNLVCKGKLNA